MRYVEESSAYVFGPVTSLWEQVMEFLPALFGALVILVIGLIIANVVAKLVKRLVRMTKIDRTLRKVELVEKMRDAGVKINVAALVAGIVKWFLIIAFLMSATDTIGLVQISDFLHSILLYIPQIVVAVVILSVAVVVANFMHNVVNAALTAANIAAAKTISTVAQWAIVMFGVLAALVQLGIAETLIETLFTGIVFALSLAFGLAFGLGGKEEANQVLARVRTKISQ